jgi:hypothetical protein
LAPTVQPAANSLAQATDPQPAAAAPSAATTPPAANDAAPAGTLDAPIQGGSIAVQGDGATPADPTAPAIEVSPAPPAAAASGELATLHVESAAATGKLEVTSAETAGAVEVAAHATGAPADAAQLQGGSTGEAQKLQPTTGDGPPQQLNSGAHATPVDTEQLQGGPVGETQQLQPATPPQAAQRLSPSVSGGDDAVLSVGDVSSSLDVALQGAERETSAVGATSDGAEKGASAIGHSLRTSTSEATRSAAGGTLLEAGDLSHVFRGAGPAAVGVGGVLDYADGKAHGRTDLDSGGHALATTAGGVVGAAVAAPVCGAEEAVTLGIATPLCIGEFAVFGAVGNAGAGWIYDHAKPSANESRCGHGSDVPCKYASPDTLPPALFVPLR